MNKTIKKIAKIGAVLGVGYLSLLGQNNLFNNKEYTEEDYHYLSRADGIWTGYTELGKESFGWGEKVYQFRPFGKSIHMFDGGIYGKCDGLVDKITIKDQEYLTRNEDYETHQEEFDEADKILVDTKERFKEYF